MRLKSSRRNAGRIGLNIGFLDRRYDAIAARMYNFRTSCVLQRDRKSGEFFSNTFFASRRIIPATTRPMVVNPNQIPDGATYIQLRLVGKAEEIQDVVVRSYVPMDVANRRVQKWKRLSPERRRQLARANVYPPVLLRDHERHRLMDNQWSLLLPKGVAGSDYHTRKLYTLKESDGQKVYRHALPYGLAIANGARGSVPVPDEKRLYSGAIQRSRIVDLPGANQRGRRLLSC